MLTDKFWRKVDRQQECWLWSGASMHGYGYVRLSDGHVYRVHVLSYQEYHGPVPEGLEVCHTCGVKLCVNPTHLYAGTHQQNMQDALRHGTFAVGERGGGAVLTNGQVMEIKQLIGTMSMRAIGTRYGVSHKAISAIARRETWKHLEQTSAT